MSEGVQHETVEGNLAGTQLERTGRVAGADRADRAARVERDDRSRSARDGGPGRQRITRADLPEVITPESVRGVPMSVLRQAMDPRSQVLSDAERQQLQDALHQMFDRTARRMNEQVGGEEWQRALRLGGPEGMRLRRLAREIDRQIKDAERLAPGVDWGALAPSPKEPALTGPSSAPAEPGAVEAPVTEASDDLDDDVTSATAAELEADLGDKVELASALTELADLSRRQFALERERDLSATRSTFFGFLVSVAVIAAGWAPIVMASPEQRVEIGWLTLATCAIAGAIYMGIRAYQRKTTDARDAR